MDKSTLLVKILIAILLVLSIGERFISLVNLKSNKKNFANKIFFCTVGLTLKRGSMAIFCHRGRQQMREGS
jgi:hypothetical protein